MAKKQAHQTAQQKPLNIRKKGRISPTDRRLIPDPFNGRMRQVFIDAGRVPSVEEEARFRSSIERDGVQEPIKLWPDGRGKLRVVGGQRRWDTLLSFVKRYGKEYPHQEIPYELVIFKSDIEHRAFVVQDNDPNQQVRRLNQQEALMVAMPPWEEEYELMYRPLKGHYAFEDLGIDPKTATPDQQQAAMELREEQLQRQRQLRSIAALHLNAKPASIEKASQGVWRRHFGGDDGDPADWKLEEEHRLEAYIVAAQRKELLAEEKKADKAASDAAAVLKKIRKHREATDRRLKRIGKIKDVDRIAAVALRKKPKEKPTDKQKKKLRIKAPVVNRQKKMDDEELPPEPKISLVDRLRQMEAGG